MQDILGYATSAYKEKLPVPEGPLDLLTAISSDIHLF